MHLPPFFLELAALAFLLAGALFAWFTRWNMLLAAVAGSCFLFVAQCILHLTDEDTVSLLVADGAMAFYGAMSLFGTIPALAGAWAARTFKHWRRT